MVVMEGETVQHKPYRHLFEIYPSGRGGGPAHIKPSPPNDDECELVSGLEVCARLPDCCDLPAAMPAQHHLERVALAIIRQERCISSTAPYGLDSCVCACEMRNVCCSVVNRDDFFASPVRRRRAPPVWSRRVLSCRVSGAGVGCIPSHDRILATLLSAHPCSPWSVVVHRQGSPAPDASKLHRSHAVGSRQLEV